MVSLKSLFVCQFLHVKISEKTINLQRLVDVLCLPAEILRFSYGSQIRQGQLPSFLFFYPQATDRHPPCSITIIFPLQHPLCLTSWAHRQLQICSPLAGDTKEPGAVCARFCARLLLVKISSSS